MPDNGKPAPLGDPPRTIRISDPVRVRELAEALGERPYVIIADLIEMGRFCSVDEEVAFEVASKIAHKHGFTAARASGEPGNK